MVLKPGKDLKTDYKKICKLFDNTKERGVISKCINFVSFEKIDVIGKFLIWSRHTCRHWILSSVLKPQKTSIIYILNCLLNIVNSNLQWNLKRNSYIFIQENVFENVVWKTAAILSRSQCVKYEQVLLRFASNSGDRTHAARLHSATDLYQMEVCDSA